MNKSKLSNNGLYYLHTYCNVTTTCFLSSNFKNEKTVAAFRDLP